LLTLLAHQLAVVKTEAQVLTGLCSLVVTVTGFSGAHMIRSGSAAAWCMVLARIIHDSFCCKLAFLAPRVFRPRCSLRRTRTT
jgi:hypothetical protein